MLRMCVGVQQCDQGNNEQEVWTGKGNQILKRVGDIGKDRSRRAEQYNTLQYTIHSTEQPHPIRTLQSWSYKGIDALKRCRSRDDGGNCKSALHSRLDAFTPCLRAHVC